MIILLYLFILKFSLGYEQPTTNIIAIQKEYNPHGVSDAGNRDISSNSKSELSSTKYAGIASYYSKAGCVGCSKNFTMANGKTLDDSKLTVAFNRAELGSMVKITNIKEGRSIIAEVSDRGGFEKLGRIIDLSVATKEAIGCSNLCEVQIEL